MGIEIFSIIFFSWVGFFTCLGLKLTGNISWGWWLVTAPIWGTFIICILIFVLLMWIEREGKS